MAWMKVAELKHHQKNAVAVGSKVSVEGTEYLSTGSVSYIEGDIIEIELSYATFFTPGEQVKLTVYSTNGFMTLLSSVIARDTGILMVLNPPENQRLATRRQFPRIDLSRTGTLEALRWSEGGENKLDEAVSLEIQNISLGGLGFHLPVDPGIRAMMVADVSLEILGGLQCSIEISRKSMSQGKIYIGARFLDLGPEQNTMLRGYILRMQVEQRARQRIEEQAAI
ncbi:PilZ domain-containing protein [Paenibacillus sp. TRM 82003]|nr:PilZ domain-containing protein [Paenibacillus sp. TRM 82003]